jgi:predicted secreted protein
LKTRHAIFFTGVLLSSLAHAGATVDLSAEASRPAVNDLVRAVVYAEAEGRNPAELSRRVNQEIAAGLQLARGKAGVSVKSGNQSTYPIYGRDQKIESWRMRSELQQRRLAVGQVSQMPSPETRRQVEDEATRDAIKAFKHRAELVAGALGKPWKIKQLAVSQQGEAPPVPVFRAAKAMMAEAMPAPLEAGESQLTTTVSGQIELLD